MGHGCHDCGCPNGCECPGTLRYKMFVEPTLVSSPTYDIWDDITRGYKVPDLSPIEMVEEFHKKFNCDWDPMLLPNRIKGLRFDLIDEELGELSEEQMKDIDYVFDTEKVLDDVESELFSATSMFGPFNSAHEGFAVLKEEVDELWDEVKAKQGARDTANMRKEAVQVAAMAMRFILDVCDGGRGQK